MKIDHSFRNKIAEFESVVPAIGDIVCYLRKWGLPVKLPISLYIFFVVVFFTLSIISLELHYLQINESLKTNFDEFKSSTFTAIKIFVVIHRFVHLLSNESSLRSTCKLLRKRLKFEQVSDYVRNRDFKVAAVAEWYRYQIVACHVTSSSPVPLKIRRVGQRCTLNLSRDETSSRWCGVVVRRGGCQLRCRPRHLTMVQNCVVRRQKPSCS
ncbi:uncharacterized protein TNCV_1777911 [Trichonephila clavipes]|nr:uncharacterized protein TNCV_1777911 [Trichonephila clavipes]